MWTHLDRRWLRTDIAFVVLCTGLLAYSVLGWQGAFGLTVPWHPIKLIALSLCLALQSVASIARLRSRRAFWILLSLSLISLAFSVMAHS